MIKAKCDCIRLCCRFSLAKICQKFVTKDDAQFFGAFSTDKSQKQFCLVIILCCCWELMKIVKNNLTLLLLLFLMNWMNPPKASKSYFKPLFSVMCWKNLWTVWPDGSFKFGGTPGPVVIGGSPQLKGCEFECC